MDLASYWWQRGRTRQGKRRWWCCKQSRWIGRCLYVQLYQPIVAVRECGQKRLTAWWRNPRRRRASNGIPWISNLVSGDDLLLQAIAHQGEAKEWHLQSSCARGKKGRKDDCDCFVGALLPWSGVLESHSAPGLSHSIGIRIILWNKNNCIGSSVSIVVAVEGRWESTRVTRPETWLPFLPWICRPSTWTQMIPHKVLQTSVIQHSHWCYKDFISRRCRSSLYHDNDHSWLRIQQDYARGKTQVRNQFNIDHEVEFNELISETRSRLIYSSSTCSHRLLKIWLIQKKRIQSRWLPPCGSCFSLQLKLAESAESEGRYEGYRKRVALWSWFFQYWNAWREPHDEEVPTHA